MRTILLMCDVNERVESKITPKLLTCEEMGTRQPSMQILRGGDLDKVDLEPMRSISLLLPFSLSLFSDIQDVIACKQFVSELGQVDSGFVDRYSCVSSA